MPSREFQRIDRVNAELRRELGTLVHAVVRDHGLPSVSVNDVQTSRDLDSATVWVTTLNPEQADEAVAGLREMAGEFRHQLAQRMPQRRVPRLRFKYDESVDTGERIESLLQQEKDQGRL